MNKKTQLVCLLTLTTVFCVSVTACKAHTSGKEGAAAVPMSTTTMDPTSGNQSDSALEEHPITASDFAAYAPYGLSYDAATKQLWFQGQRVRYFEDLYPLDWNDPQNGMTAGMTFWDEQGTVDVHANRDLSVKQYHADGSYDPSGILCGVSADSQAVFDERDIEPFLNPQHAVTASGEPLTAEEMATLYGVYAPYDMTYDGTKDALYYKGEKVRYFQDLIVSNGESMQSGKFSGTIRNHYSPDGTVDVNAIRDTSQKDAEGNDVLIGLKAASQTEFDEHTTRNATRKDEGGTLIRHDARDETTAQEGINDENNN